jgi:hypothetical protein
VLSYTAKVPAALMKEQVFSGTMATTVPFIKILRGLTKL